MKRLNATKPWARPAEQPAPEVITETPARAASFTADLIVPLAQAMTTGGLVGALVVFVGGELKPWAVDPFKVWAGVALFVAAVAWLLLLVDTRKLLWGIERLTGLDINQDGATGKPTERIVVVNAGQAREKAAQQQAAERASEFARFVSQLEARGTDARTWEKELTRPVYQQYRDALIRLGWAQWNSTKRDGTPNERRGWSLVKPAAEILKRIEG